MQDTGDDDSSSSSSESPPLLPMPYVDDNDDDDDGALGVVRPRAGMPGNPLMRGASMELLPVVVATKGLRASGGGASRGAGSLPTMQSPTTQSPATSRAWRSEVKLFDSSEYAAVARAHNEATLMATSIAAYLRRSSLDEALVRELLYLISNPYRAEIIRALPEFRKAVQRVRTVSQLPPSAEAVRSRFFRPVAQASAHGLGHCQAEHPRHWQVHLLDARAHALVHVCVVAMPAALRWYVA